MILDLLVIICHTSACVKLCVVISIEIVISWYAQVVCVWYTLVHINVQKSEIPVIEYEANSEFVLRLFVGLSDFVARY